MVTAAADSVVKKILATDRRIQFCAIVNSGGKLEAGGMRHGVRSLEPAAETARIVTRMFLNQGLAQVNDPSLGRTRWIMIQRDKVIQITFPLPEGRQLQIAASIGYPISKAVALKRYADGLAKAG